MLGAHTLGFNSHSSAIAVIGNYAARTVPAAVRKVIAQVAAYKLGAYGNLATGRTTLLSSGSDRYPKGSLVNLMRISGHRDAGRTACPGDALYGQLASIRTIAGGGAGRAAAARDDRRVARSAARTTRAAWSACCGPRPRRPRCSTASTCTPTAGSPRP